MAATGAVRLPVQSDLSKPVEPCQGLGVKLVLVSVVAITSGCVPMAKPLPTGTSTLNAPPPPASQKNATSLLNETPSIVAPNEPPPPLPGQRHVNGAWRWTGTEYRWIPAHNEAGASATVWKRE